MRKIVSMICVLALVITIPAVFGGQTVVNKKILPQPTPRVSMIASPSDRNCTITIASVNGSARWSNVWYALVDLTDCKNITSGTIGSNTTALITTLRIGNVTAGNLLTIKCISPYVATWPLMYNHQYRFSLVYNVTKALMGTVTWTQ